MGPPQSATEGKLSTAQPQPRYIVHSSSKRVALWLNKYEYLSKYVDMIFTVFSTGSL